MACTLSREEDAFRIWAKNKEPLPAGVAGATSLWRCLYKVNTPSGYANLSRGVSLHLGQQLLAFSFDGTVLCVSYGPYVTLWDHSNATLLASLTVGNDGAIHHTEDIQSVNFLSKRDDTILVATAGQICVKSPFGGAKSRYLGEDEWSFHVGSSSKGGVVSAIVPLPRVIT